MGWKDREEDPPVVLRGKIEAKTPKAILFDYDFGDKPEWMPRSQIVDMQEEGEEWVVTVKAWWAKKVGWQP